MPKKLKIAMLFSSDASSAGGVQEHVYHLSKGLEKKGHHVAVFGTGKNILPFSNYQSVGQVFPVPSLNGNWGNILLPYSDKKIDALVRNTDYDLWHIHEPYLPAFSWQIIKESPLPKVATFHTAWNNNSVLNMFNPFLPLFKNTFSKNVEGAIFVSEIVRKRWRHLCARRVFQRKIIHGVDREIFYPLEYKTDRNRISILFLARLVSRKGPQYLLKAMIELIKKYPDIRLDVVGDGMDRQKFEQFANEKKIKDNVFFRGEIVGDKRVSYYQRADIFCAPYADEAFGLTVLEAMACGCPIVGFKNESFKEMLKNYPGQNLLVKQKDVKALTKALEKLIVDDGLRKELSDWCVKESQKYGWDRIITETEVFYRQVLNHPDFDY
jgi:phosphatidylinositol alpha-mannosyltransferase